MTEIVGAASTIGRQSYQNHAKSLRPQRVHVANLRLVLLPATCTNEEALSSFIGILQRYEVGKARTIQFDFIRRLTVADVR